MATSDATLYVRAKDEERKHGKTASFMKDGFNKWAESERPARYGGMEKSPAEAVSMQRNVGGARASKKSVDDLLMRASKFIHSDEGRIDSTGGRFGTTRSVRLGPSGVAQVQRLGSGKYVKQELPAELEKYLERTYGNGMHGGFSLSRVFGIAKDVIKFMKDNKELIHAVLENDAVNKVAKNYPEKLAKGLKLVGLGEGEESESEEEGEMEMEEKGGARKTKGRKIMEAVELEGGRKKKMYDVPASYAKGKVSQMGSGKKSARAEIVKKVMKEHGLSLPAASKYVKEHKLY